MNGPFLAEYWQAACVEVETLEEMDAWDVVEREPEMNVLPSTWAFKCKRFPDGLIEKFKARFCAHCDKQIEGIDYFETFAPMVQWITVRLMLILECLLGLVSKQGDVTCAYLHAHLPDNERVYVEMHLGFKQYNKQGTAKVLKLKSTLYSLKQSPRAFWKFVTEKLVNCGMEQSVSLSATVSFAWFMWMICYFGKRKTNLSMIWPKLSEKKMYFLRKKAMWLDFWESNSCV